MSAVILIAMVVGFAVGSIPTGYVLVRMVRGDDVRRHGSGNIGATNVGRVLGRWGWIATFVGDAMKGAAPVWWFVEDPTAAAVAALGAILGHCYTPWLKGRGGKGVATMLGAFVVVSAAAVGVVVATFVAVLAIGRRVSLASLIAAMALPIACWSFGLAAPAIAAAAATTVIVLVRHRDNIERLRRGTESRVGEGSTS